MASERLAGEKRVTATQTAAAGLEVQRQVPVGAERPTLVERILSLLPIPYTVAALLMGYLASGSLQASLESYFYGYMPARGWQQVVAIVLWTAFYAALCLTIRRGRRSVVKTQTELASLLPDEAAADAFRSVSALIPALLIGLAVEVLMLDDYRMRMAVAQGPAHRWYEALSGPSLYLMSGTAIWVYARSVWGLYKLGRGPLELKPFYEDRSMGLRPLASLSLSLSATYFSLLLIMVLNLLIGPVLPEYVVVVAALTLLGVALFFVPLLSAHTRMKREKKAIQQTVKARWQKVLAEQLDGAGSAAPSTDLTTVVTLEALERKLAAVSTWPFDVPILSKLGVMALSIVLALVTQIVKNLVGL